MWQKQIVHRLRRSCQKYATTMLLKAHIVQIYGNLTQEKNSNCSS